MAYPIRTPGWTTVVGIVAIKKAIKNDSMEIITCSAVLAGEYEASELSIGVPSVIGSNGIDDIIERQLNPDERKSIQQSTNVKK